MDPTPAERYRADRLRRAIRLRTGIRPRELECPREGSEMTPCIARDGRLAVVRDVAGPICVGCEVPLDRPEAEEARRRRP